MREATDTTAQRRIILAGANPGLRLFDADGHVVAFASIWMVDWSIRGAGTAVVLWHQGRVRVISGDVDLAAWLERYFVRSFLEVQGLDWPEPTVERDWVEVSMNLADGLSAKAADVQIEMAGVLDRRHFSTDTFLLDERPHSLSLVIAPVRSARLTIGGEPVPGFIQVDGNPTRPGSSAYLTTAEIWRR
jgi:hypothetical protein